MHTGIYVQLCTHAHNLPEPSDQDLVANSQAWIFPQMTVRLLHSRFIKYPLTILLFAQRSPCPSTCTIRKGNNTGRQLENNSEVSGHRGEEQVGWDGGLGSNVECVHTEHIDQEGIDGGWRAEDLPEQGVGELKRVEVA